MTHLANSDHRSLSVDSEYKDFQVGLSPLHESQPLRLLDLLQPHLDVLAAEDVQEIAGQRD